MKLHKPAKPSKPRAARRSAKDYFGPKRITVSNKVMDQLLESIRNPGEPTETMKRLMADFRVNVKAL